MANVKWIKITTDMFDNSKIKQLRRLPDGNNVILVWVMLLTLAGKCNAGGMIILAENIPYTPEMISTELGFELTTIQMALEALEKFRMIEMDDGCFSIRNWSEYQNTDGLERIREQTRDRVARCREKKKDCNVTVTLPVTQSSISISPSINNSFSEEIKEIIDYFNKVTNKRYTYKNKSIISHIKARLGEGFTVDDFKTVIDKMYAIWGSDSKMSQYVRPETLFSPKFESYLNMTPAVKNGKEQSVEDFASAIGDWIGGEE